jgi:hypothetical protein
MGGVELDFREALFSPRRDPGLRGAVMGGVEILVPPGVRVETDGFAFMGGFDEETGGNPESRPRAPNAPVLRVSGFAFMGAVEVSSRLPGESVRDAKRRRKKDGPAPDLERRGAVKAPLAGRPASRESPVPTQPPGARWGSFR